VEWADSANTVKAAAVQITINRPWANVNVQSAVLAWSDAAVNTVTSMDVAAIQAARELQSDVSNVR